MGGGWCASHPDHLNDLHKRAVAAQMAQLPTCPDGTYHSHLWVGSIICSSWSELLEDQSESRHLRVAGRRGRSCRAHSSFSRWLAIALAIALALALAIAIAIAIARKISRKPGSTCTIKGYGNSSAEYGGDAVYGCTATTSTGVLQVTWQRLFRDESIENLATYSKRFGEQINEPYHGKVVFREASLNSTSITLRNVTWGDEGCYVCSFNAYPDGSKRKEICLKVEGISKVDTSHFLSSSQKGEERFRYEVFSCSATGKPAPTVDWDISPEGYIVAQPPTAAAKNSDQTFTSSRNVTLRVPADWRGRVECVLNRGRKGQRRQTIPFSDEPEQDKGEEHPRLHIPVAVTFVGLTICMTGVVVAVLLKRKRSGHSPKDPSSS